MTAITANYPRGEISDADWWAMSLDERRAVRRREQQKCYRRIRAWHVQQQRDEQRETGANGLVCLIEALIEMRPYVPEERLA
ncbi:MAG TPA: hypothetical protein VGH84_14540 [Steroidobacteraceae bacterium]|jgi:hypothetical protein